MRVEACIPSTEGTHTERATDYCRERHDGREVSGIVTSHPAPFERGRACRDVGRSRDGAGCCRTYDGENTNLAVRTVVNGPQPARRAWPSSATTDILVLEKATGRVCSGGERRSFRARFSIWRSTPLSERGLLGIALHPRLSKRTPASTCTGPRARRELTPAVPAHDVRSLATGWTASCGTASTPDVRSQTLSGCARSRRMRGDPCEATTTAAW